MLAMVGVLDLEATSADASVLQLLDYMREHTMLTRVTPEQYDAHYPTSTSPWTRCPDPGRSALIFDAAGGA